MTNTIHPQQVEEAASSIRLGLKHATEGLIDRETLVDLIALAAVAGEHLLVIGPPGTAKSAAVRRVSAALGGQYFEYLLGRFTEPSELFGPVDLKKLREGIVETAVEGMLPEAEIAFLDEVFLASTAVLNTLLGILNERTFRRGHTQIQCPLRVCVAAANHLPEDESLAAFADRFLLHTFVEPVPDNRLEELLRGGWSIRQQAFEHVSRLEQLDFLANAAKQANLEKLYQPLSHCIQLLRKNGVVLSDRRLVKAMSVISAAAALRGSLNPDQADLWPLIFVIPTLEGQEQGRDVLKDMLSASQNTTLGAAAELASLGPLARAQQITEKAKTLIATYQEQPSDELKLQIEAIGREIDACFIATDIPEPLAQIKATIGQLVDEAL